MRRQTLLALSFGAVYVIWGSTYLAIRVGLESISPFALMGVRSVLAGAVLYVWARTRGAARPDRSHWATAAAVGVLLFVGGHGGLAWSQQRLASGVASLLVATVPMWMTVLEWRRTRGPAPGGRVWLGLLLGFAGVTLLSSPQIVLGSRPVDPAGAVVLLAAAFSWASGSVLSRHARLPSSAPLTAGMGLLAGGTGLLLIGALAGELTSLPAASSESLLALLYLVVAGSVVAFAAYVWLLRETTPAQVSTYAFVNPVVALFLGWALGGEPLSPRILAAAALMLAGVVSIVARRGSVVRSVKPRTSETAVITAMTAKEVS